jgi:hypothetical protein
MKNVLKKIVDGVRVEGYGLTKSQFDAACAIVEFGKSESGFDSLEDASPYVDEWLNNEEFDVEYRAWLKKCLEGGAEIYSYTEHWQPINEIAIFK